MHLKIKVILDKIKRNSEKTDKKKCFKDSQMLQRFTIPHVQIKAGY